MISTENIFIFSGEIGSGKTTVLSQWARNTNSIGGFLSPQLDGKRWFHNLVTGEKRQMEKDNASLLVGKYRFDEAAFAWAEEELYRQFQSGLEWIIIDEIGPLELRKEKGFHNLTVKILEGNAAYRPKPLFVVRDFLVDEFLEKYQIKKSSILPKMFFQSNRPGQLKGLVLCGGESKRMNADKALLQYGAHAQWQKTQNMLMPFCGEVVLSVNEKQWQVWAQYGEGNFTVDKAQFKNNGPLTGLLSSMENSSGTGYFVAAIDYPFLKSEHLIKLLNARDHEHLAVCFENSGCTEPLISILEAEAVALLHRYYESGGNSVSRFLNAINTKRITPENTDFLLNVNSVEEFLNFSSLTKR